MTPKERALPFECVPRTHKAEGMANLIKFVCEVDHGVPTRSGFAPTLTVREGSWAFCRGGGHDQHEWQELSAADSIEHLRSVRPQERTPA